MVFSSHIFLFGFLPLFLGLYYFLPRQWRTGLLIAASYIFYGWWNPWFCLLMLFSTAIDYTAGLFIAGKHATPRTRRPALVISVCSNLALLGYFKYAAFIADNLNRAAASLGIEPLLPVLQIALPVGISFYTFQSMSYAIDLYRGEARPARSFADFAAFVALFPQLVAGPIIRYRDLDDQLRERDHTPALFAHGLERFITGLARKVLIANPCGEVADLFYNSATASPGAAWFGLFAYAFQIYFDFSGYSRMAIGLGAMIGFRFPENFNAPYRARSITEFWRRWHISLSTFLRNYLYIPLGGNRHGTPRTLINLMLVMLIGGFWHGAQWTFVIWGGLHGVLLIADRLLPLARLPRTLRGMLGVPATFLGVSLLWVFFRSENLDVAARVFGALFGAESALPGTELLDTLIFRPYLMAAMGAAFLWACLESNAGTKARPINPLRAMGLLVLFVATCAALFTQDSNPFLYFQF